MSKRLPEHIRAAEAEAIRLGATFELKQGGKHFIGVICINGKCRKTSLSQSPSGMTCRTIERYIRRTVEEMKCS